MVTKGALIFRDITYIALVVIILLPTNPLGISVWIKIFIIIIAIAQRIWQHVSYYKVTGKIY